MSKPKHRPHQPTDETASCIIRILEKVGSTGHHPYEIYADWLKLVEACLTALPAHATSLSKTQSLAQDTPETAELFARLRHRYKPQHFEHFAEAFAELVSSVDPDDPQDVLGEIYMAWSRPSSWAGQFFTPMTVAKMMALIVVQGSEQTVVERLREAWKAARPEQFEALQFMLTGPASAEYFVHRFLDADIMAHYDPVDIEDCACGSGVMFLAAASVLPHWMVAYGLVQFYGNDIDEGCVRMARINIMLYGLNGWGLRWSVAGAEMQANLPEIPVCPLPANRITVANTLANPPTEPSTAAPVTPPTGGASLKLRSRKKVPPQQQSLF